MISKKKNYKKRNYRKTYRRYKKKKYGGHKCECTAKCSNSNLTTNTIKGNPKKMPQFNKIISNNKSKLKKGLNQANNPNKMKEIIAQEMPGLANELKAINTNNI